MKNPDLTDNIIGNISAQLVFERIIQHLQNEGIHPRSLPDRTLKVIAALGVHALFLDLHERHIFPSSRKRQGSLASDLSQSLYHPVRNEVERKLQLSS